MQIFSFASFILLLCFFVPVAPRTISFRTTSYVINSENVRARKERRYYSTCSYYCKLQLISYFSKWKWEQFLVVQKNKITER